MKEHVGFCLGIYDYEFCKDCFAHEDCLKLREKEQNEFQLKWTTVEDMQDLP